MKFSIFQESRVGRRKYNQDRVGHAYTRDSLLMVVADGMGGHLHGEVASQITVELFVQHFQQKATPTLKSPWQFLKDSALRAHDAILTYAAKHHMMESPRTTVVAAIIQDGLIYWAHVGDSRLYMFRQSQCVALTRDHSKVRQMLDRGEITEAEAEVHPERNRLYNCIGSMMIPDIELGGKVPIQVGDVVLLSTDGMWGPLPTPELIQGMTRYPLQFGVPQLLDKAEMLAGQGCDNLSAVALTWLEDDQTTALDAVTTHTLPLDAVNSQIDAVDLRRLRPEERDITNEEIESAINEIHEALKKYSNK